MPSTQNANQQRTFLLWYADILFVQGMLFVCTFGGAVVSWCGCLWIKHSGVEPWLGTLRALCSWARHLTLTVPLSIQVYKWVPVNLILEVALD